MLERDGESLTVVKIGGSLTRQADFPVRLRRWLADHHGRLLLVVGGGAMADEVRRWSRDFHIAEEPAHWLAVHAMSLQARLLAAILPPAALCHTFDDLQHATGNILIFDSSTLLQADAGQTLPMNWEVTSDAIAAWVARKIGCRRIILLKMVGEPGGFSLDQAVAAGWLDPYFQPLASGTVVEWTNWTTGATWTVGARETGA